MAEYIERGTAIAKLTALEVTSPSATMTDAKRLLADMPAVDVEKMSDGYHTFADLYEQRKAVGRSHVKRCPEIAFNSCRRRCAGGAVQGLQAQHIAVRAYPAVWEAGYADLSQYARTE